MIHLVAGLFLIPTAADAANIFNMPDPHWDAITFSIGAMAVVCGVAVVWASLRNRNDGE